MEGGVEEFVGHDVFCPTWGRFSPSEERCTMLYRNSVVVLISSYLSPSLLLSPSCSFSCHLSKSEAGIGFDLLSGGTFEPADTDPERLGRCRNLKAISQRQFRPSNPIPERSVKTNGWRSRMKRKEESEWILSLSVRETASPNTPGQTWGHL